MNTKMLTPCVCRRVKCRVPGSSIVGMELSPGNAYSGVKRQKARKPIDRWCKCYSIFRFLVKTFSCFMAMKNESYEGYQTEGKRVG